METQIIIETIREIRDSVVIINSELGQVKIDVAILKSQMTGLIWWSRAIVGAFILLFADRAWKVIVNYKHNHNEKKGD